MRRKDTSVKIEAFQRNLRDADCRICKHISEDKVECLHPYRYFKHPENKGCAFWRKGDNL